MYLDFAKEPRASAILKGQFTHKIEDCLNSLQCTDRHIIFCEQAHLDGVDANSGEG